MKTYTKVIFIVSACVSSICTGIVGYFAGRRSVTPVKFNGNLIIDHQPEPEKPPIIYLEQLDESVLKEHRPIILNVKHYKKSRK